MTDLAPGRILIVEDERHIRMFLRLSLEAQGFAVEEARLAEEGLRACTELRPDLVILDLGLPDLDGQDFIRRLRDWSQIPILVLSVRADERDKVAALDSGANDYVTKPFGIAELMARVRTLLRTSRRLTVEDAPGFAFGPLHIDLAARCVRLDGARLSLSPKEFELLRLLAIHAGRVLTHAYILRELWGPDRVEETHYLRVLVGHLRRKLGEEATQPCFIHTEPGVGYCLRPPA